MKKRKITTLFLSIFIILSFFVLSIGYPILTQKLAINGNIIVRSDIDVRITDIKLKSSTEATQTSQAEYTKNTILGNINLKTKDSEIIYEITIANLSSENILITNILKLNWDDNIQYELENLEINKTQITSSATSKFTIKIHYKEEISKQPISQIEFENIIDNTNINFSLQLTFYKIPQYKLQIDCNIKDALIIIEKDNQIYKSSQGNFLELFDEGTQLTIKTSKIGYNEQIIQVTMNSNKIYEINLNESTKYKITFSSTTSDALITLTSNDEIIATGIGTQSIEIFDNQNIDYTITKLGYKDHNGTYKVTGNNNINIQLEELPWITGTYINTNQSEPTIGTQTVYHPGYYLVEMWGGKGGNQYYNKNNNGYGGESGYIYGIIYLEYNQNIYYTIGGNGQDAPESTISINGGNGGIINNNKININIGSVFKGTDGTTTSGGKQTYGIGGTEQAQPTNETSGSILTGGNLKNKGGGGGAGYYGGSGGTGMGTSASNSSGGGGGGSSFISSEVIYDKISDQTLEKLTHQNPSQTGGSIIITYIDQTTY